MKQFILSFRLALTLGCLLVGLACQAQAPAWQMAIAVANPGLADNSVVSASATDAAGNVYIVGSFSRVAIFGSTTLVSPGPYDMFVAKWSPASGGFVWAKQTTSTSSGYASAKAVVVRGSSVYVAGSFVGPTVLFDGMTLANTGISNYEDLFVTKLEDTGSTASFEWLQSVGGARDEVATGLAVAENLLYLTGHSGSSTANFGGITLAGKGYSDGFVAKLRDNGSSSTFSWVQPVAGPSTDDVTAVVASPSSNDIYVTGFFYDTVTLGSATLTSAGGADMYVAKLTDQGATVTLAWARPLGGAANDIGAGLAVQGSAVYVAGTFNGATTSFGTTTLTSAGGADACLIKLTDAGTTSTVGWVQKVGGALGDVGGPVAVQGNAVYLLGQFGIGPSNSASATATVGSTTISSVGGCDLFLAKFTDAGSTSSLAWVQQAGSNDLESTGGLSLNGPTIYVSGSFNGTTLLLNPLSLPKPYNNVGSAFLASLTDSALPTRASSALAGLGLWPNPTRGAASVLVPADAGPGPATLTLLDAVGRAVRTQAAAPGLTTALDLAHLAPGVYALRVQVGQTVAVRQLVVE